MVGGEWGMKKASEGSEDSTEAFACSGERENGRCSNVRAVHPAYLVGEGLQFYRTSYRYRPAVAAGYGVDKSVRVFGEIDRIIQEVRDLQEEAGPRRRGTEQ